LEATEGSQVVKANGQLSTPTHPLERHGPDVTDQYVYDRVANELVSKNRTGLRTAFNDRAQMENSIAETIVQRQVEIDAWIAGWPRAGVPKLFEANPGFGTIGANSSAATAEIGARADGLPSRLYHYTNETGMNGIVDSKALNPSLKALNPNDVRYGNGQYL
jgi:hypothetical protein